MSNSNQKSVIDNKKVLSNTIFLYIRMLFMMLIGFYTVRLALDALGVVDYGIYNVVGSVVMLCQFLTGSLTATSNRFFSTEMVRGTKHTLNNCFCLNVTVFGLLIIIATVLLETVGLWYVNYKMIIPLDRLFAANVVYQLSIFSLVLSFITIPYNGLIVAHEQMSVYAYLGILDSMCKFFAVFILYQYVGDKLVLYAILIILTTLLCSLITIIYCSKKYEESRCHLYWNKKQFKEIFDFVGWYFLGSVSFVVKAQGLNILINAFFNPAINAARAVAFQVDSALKKFSDGYFTAAKPQIYKAYSNDEYAGLNLLINRTSIICIFMMSVFAIPVSINADFVLSLWLKDVPVKSVVFLQLVVVDSVINISSEPVILTIMATAKQKWYQISEFMLRVLTLPVSYFILEIGAQPEFTIVVCAVLSFISVFIRAGFLKSVFSRFDVMQYFRLLSKVIFVITIVTLIAYLPTLKWHQGWISLITSTCISTILLVLLFSTIILSKHDKDVILNNIKNRLRK